MLNNTIKMKTGETPYQAVNRQKEPGKYTVVDDENNVIKVLTKTSGKSNVEQHHRTEIKKMVERAEREGLFRASTRFEGEMDDFPAYDFMEAQFHMARANSMFESLPSQVRQKFDNNPAAFMQFANNPDNAQEMVNMGLKRGLDSMDNSGVSTGTEAIVNPPTETEAGEAHPEQPPA